ncbi:hypothetical protein [Neobacillus drentensis]|uniref:hypothetical protein n=1 Tax=Neobacillus drentensis TaxID=220684 RepID=UPI003002121C
MKWQAGFQLPELANPPDSNDGRSFNRFGLLFGGEDKEKSRGMKPEKDRLMVLYFIIPIEFSKGFLFHFISKSLQFLLP